MAQDFPNFDESPGGDDVRTALLNLRTRTISLQSTFSGTSLPTPVEGQMSYRTDTDKLWICTDAAGPTWTEMAIGVVPLTLGGTGATTASGVRSAIGLGNAATLNLASQAEAQAGTSSTTLMTPQRASQAISALGMKVKASTSDTTPKTLYEKLAPGNGVSFTIQNSGGDEILLVNASGSETGDFTWSARTSKSGWLLCNGLTIGDAGSGATSRANADTSDLYTILWTNTTNSELPIQDSSGSSTSRGASAAADFAAGKRLPLPDVRGRTFVGKDDMGATVANRITAGGSGIDGTLLLASGGAETHSLNSSQNGPHTHTISGVISSITTGDQNGGSGVRFISTKTGTTSSSGSGSPHNNTQPSIVGNCFIKL